MGALIKLNKPGSSLRELEPTYLLHCLYDPFLLWGLTPQLRHRLGLLAQVPTERKSEVPRDTPMVTHPKFTGSRICVQQAHWNSN